MSICLLDVTYNYSILMKLKCFHSGMILRYNFKTGLSLIQTGHIGLYEGSYSLGQHDALLI